MKCGPKKSNRHLPRRRSPQSLAHREVSNTTLRAVLARTTSLQLGEFLRRSNNVLQHLRVRTDQREAITAARQQTGKLV
ncbi:hypothetical protein Deipe_3881 (plasmid) [Deinococcus peraridilitoris DSM 19664]|uniref:Uncharacterized protein n=1 Tax=Deinococcus peraridilitoris (strain DSM 19664 / LMG 22246 / CIP 109416 / KR-200) TaxID=937777 RepID=L0A619_DEIPD|nr:hypothetical protein Deipe_3881 [Deinococcus peraridilitoris DSM 19664]